MRPEDEAFIYSSWLKSFRASKTNAGLGGKYYDKQAKKITSILERNTTRVIVACSKDDVDHILGYIVFEPSPEVIVLHYVYVKDAFRQMGVATRLVGAVKEGASESGKFDLFCSHLPANLDIYEAAQRAGIEYDPELIGGPRHE